MKRVEIIVPELSLLVDKHRNKVSEYRNHEVFESIFGIFRKIANRIITPEKTVMVMLNEINENFRVSGARWLIVDFMRENVFPNLCGDDRNAEASFRDALDGIPEFWLRRPKPPVVRDDDSEMDDYYRVEETKKDIIVVG